MESNQLQSSFLNTANAEAERLKRMKAQQSLSGSSNMQSGSAAAAVGSAGLQAAGIGGAEDTSTAGNAASGAMSGLQAGLATGNPYAAAGGAIIGGIAGGLSANAKRKKKEREADAQALRNNSQIEQNAGIARSNAIQSLAANISATLLGR